MTTAAIALIGNPNCGKTALFNALTGSRQKVANYAGVTVERKEGRLTTPNGQAVRLLDLPGTYSLRARSPDEAITRDAVLGHLADETIPDLLLCVGDATNLRLTLRLVLELRALGRPVMLALNMFDIARHRGIHIDCAKLEAELGLPVVTSIAVRRAGTQDLLALVDRVLPAQLSIDKSAIDWRAPDRSEIRQMQNEADRILKACVAWPETPDTTSGRIDAVLLHPVAGMVILLSVLFLMFQAVFTWAQIPMDAIKDAFHSLANIIGPLLPDGLLRSFVLDGLISGIGAVLVFLPQILILFLFILLLEDFGYMARAAFLMDRFMGVAGLHGRAFIPLLSSFACAIPGIMATRVIDGKRDRLATILVAPLMTCSARIPVYTLIIAAFVPRISVGPGLSLQGLVMFGLYAAGILSALAVSFIFRRIFWANVPSEPFLMELPDYKRPDARNILFGLIQRAVVFLKRAGTTILAMMIVIWCLASLPRPPEGADAPPITYSYAAKIGRAMEPVFAPIGFNWQINVALIPGMAAREVAVASLATVYAIEGSSGDDTEPNADLLGQTLASKWSLATALALLAWYVFAPQCASTLATIRRETGSWGWAGFVFFYMFALAYGAAFICYQTACWFGLG